MNGKHLLADDRDDALVAVIQLKVEADDVSPKLPAQPLDVGDVLHQVKHLVGYLELRAVGHGHKMALMQGEELPLNVRHQVPLGIGDVRLVVDGGELGVRLIEDPFPVIGDVDVLVQGQNLRGGKKGIGRLAKARHIVLVRGLAGLAVAVVFRCNAH